jgi:hypothetical protein
LEALELDRVDPHRFGAGHVQIAARSAKDISPQKKFDSPSSPSSMASKCRNSSAAARFIA